MRTFLFALLLLGSAGLAWSAEGTLAVRYGDTRRVLSRAELAALPRLEVDATDHGQPHRYNGVAVRDILELVGAPLGDRLRGSAVALVVRAVAADGYVAAYALAEFDAAFRERTILLADTQDGQPLPANAGPWRFICPGDKRGARSIRQVVSLEVISLADLPDPLR